MIVAKEVSSVQSWGNSTAFRLPKQLANLLEFHPNDKIHFQVEMDKFGNKRLIVDKIQEVQTIHDLFSDYEGGSFQAEIVEFEPKGNELW